MKLIVNNLDISDYVQTVDWSGSVDTISRTLDVDMQEVQAEVGDKVKFYPGDEAVFEGVVMFTDGHSFTAFDYGIYLDKNITTKEYTGDAPTITRQVCSEFDVSVGNLAPVSESRKIVSTGNLSAYKVIEQAYEGTEDIVSRKYYTVMIGTSLNVLEIGSEVVANIEAEISDARRTQSIKNMINRVIILDGDAKKTGEVENSDDRAKFGTFTSSYREQEDVSATEEAKKSLQSIEKTGNIDVLGDIKCVAGKAVYVTERKVGFSGKMKIKSDSHKWKNGGYTMKLEFLYE